MFYLFQYKKEFAITIGVFVSILLIFIWDIWAIFHGQLSWENLLASLGGIVEIMAWWTNMPTSEANAKATAQERFEKAELKRGEIQGEEIDIDDEDEEEDDEEEEEEEEEKEESDDQGE